MNRCFTGRLVVALLLQFSFTQSTFGETTSSFDEIPTFSGPSSIGAQLIEENQRQAGSKPAPTTKIWSLKIVSRSAIGR